jgi:hypothetical protein
VGKIVPIRKYKEWCAGQQRNDLLASAEYFAAGFLRGNKCEAPQALTASSKYFDAGAPLVEENLLKECDGR